MKNERLEVVRADGAKVIVRNSSGVEKAVTAKQAKSFNVYESRAVELAAGDRLLFTANRRDRGFRATNGEIVTVSRVDEHGLIRLDDGRILPRDYKQFAHGYAVTAHRSQGKSVDSVIISGDGMRRELFYVAASRGRESIQVVTSDTETLRETVVRSTARKSATELARLATRGERRGIAEAAHMTSRNHHGPGSDYTRVPTERQVDVAIERRIEPERGRDRSYEHGFSR